MKEIRITNAAYRAVEAAADAPFANDGEQLPNGDWIVEVDEEVFEAIERINPLDYSAAILAVTTGQIGRA